ncbi:hypothetical protein GJ744_002388 [Endocarpon pusillum]|uniref:WD repeat-containing protein n=1 Tax=Endocarpon pusillum TaxID=364733 RepID=A0A8H7ASH7_9EURO|nr:hypothetical protein GJ744_002388 [Endocarpon pusillum]
MVATIVRTTTSKVPSGRPPDLLEDRKQELLLESYSDIRFVEAVKAFTTFPLFDLQDTTTSLLLCSIPDHPVRLHSALSSELIASYPFVNATTEAYIAPHSLLFTGHGRNFIAGSSNLVATFDVTRPGHGPSSLFVTASSRRSRKVNGSIGLRGIVSALSIDPASKVLAAGTFSRHVGLYDAAGEGESLGMFKLDGNEADGRIGGRGITQLIWSPCGRYLYIVERQSHGIMVYDIRKSGQLLSWAEGRMAETNQRLRVDLFSSPNASGDLELWAGGVDGNIRVWRNTHCQEGGQRPDLDWHLHHDAVSSTTVHPSGTVVASCSGQRHFELDQHDSSDPDERSGDETDVVIETTFDNSLKLWAI